MKTQLLKLATLTILLLIVFTACDKKLSARQPITDKENTASQERQPLKGPATIDQLLTMGTWRIESFMDNSINNTANVSDFSIQFSVTGNVTATNTNTVFTGSWVFSNVNNQLVLNFANQGAFNDLTHSWTVIQASSVQIKLKDVDNGNMDFLTLNKNLIK